MCAENGRQRDSFPTTAPSSTTYLSFCGCKHDSTCNYEKKKTYDLHLNTIKKFIYFLIFLIFYIKVIIQRYIPFISLIYIKR